MTVAGLIIASGCSRKEPAQPTASVEQTTPALEAAFKAAPLDVRQEAVEAVTALQSQNDAAAFRQLQELSQRPSLTPEQRQAAVNSWLAVNARLRQAAADGNTAAQQLLEKHRASK